MEKYHGQFNIGIVLLSSDFRVVGMNPYARKILGSAALDLGKTVFDYHKRTTHPKIDALLSECFNGEIFMPLAMIMDVLNKFLLVHLSRVDMQETFDSNFYSMSFIDVTEQTGARRNPVNQQMQIDKFPVFFKDSFLILGIASIYFIRSDGNYCVVFTPDQSYYLLLTLKSVLARYSGTNFAMVHKSFIVNLDHVRGVERKDGQTVVVFDRPDISDVPVARRRLRELKAAIGAPNRSSA